MGLALYLSRVRSSDLLGGATRQCQSTPVRPPIKTGKNIYGQSPMRTRSEDRTQKETQSIDAASAAASELLTSKSSAETLITPQRAVVPKQPNGPWTPPFAGDRAEMAEQTVHQLLHNRKA